MRQLLDHMELGEDNIYSSSFTSYSQQDEIKIREALASQQYFNYYEIISNHHSIPVMDQEVAKFLLKIPRNGCIIDVGGCWGWHWRHLSQQRPDVSLVIIDFIRGNLQHAAQLLREQVNKNIFLVHGEATQLPFPEKSFHGYWSVQVLQHIPNFEQTVSEAYRVLKPSAVFSSYSVNNIPWVGKIYKILGRQYEGSIAGKYYLARGNDRQAQIIETIFGSKVVSEYSEVLFQKEFRTTFSGKMGSWLGKIDAMLTGKSILHKYIARQRAFHVIKSNSEVLPFLVSKLDKMA